MPSNLMGFTLIELLVVVLIIGILAAVAVPQYQKAVWRSKNVQLKTLVSNVAKAQQTYYLANGKYATNLNELDVDVPAWQSRSEMGTSDVCQFTTTHGQDSVRFTDNLFIGLSQSGNIYGAWSTGPYRCGGFYYRAKGNKIYCMERYDSKAAKNHFCVNLEHAVFSSTLLISTWYYYTL
ncbi:MAG: prepilin-type N-terminal cleavage/methylation domain-containing protein [Elusimicrobiaceae bacterium]|nr:prepilin-type N-terminal cleavage/methylation domain-containing protein [Elusimicrobiaceae bacterium]